MTSKLIDILDWAFQFGLLAILAATIVFARRLEAVLRQVRNDHDALQAVLQQIDGSITTAVSATDRLMHDSAGAERMLNAARQSAEAAARKLDDLIGQANLVLSAPPPLEPVASDPTALGGALPVRASARKPAKPLSRGERDLARILLDAS